MATADGLLGSSPLKAPAIEIVELSSDDESRGEIATGQLVEDDDSEDGEDQWSMYEDALAEMDDEGPADEGMKTRVASVPEITATD